MSGDEIMAAMFAILSEQMMHPHLEGFGPEARLNEDLYLDSVLILQVFLNLELEYGLAMPEKAISKQDVATVADFVALFDPQEAAMPPVPAPVIEGVHGEAPYDIKVHCFVSCVCDAVKRAGLDHRPFYFGVWDAKFAVNEKWQLRYHAPEISQEFFHSWYQRLYGVTVREWYDPDLTKLENLGVMLDLVERRPETGYVMVMLDMFHLPERENKFNQNPFPHYLMLSKTEDPENWFVLDPDYRWQGEIARDKIIHAVMQPTVGGGYVFDRAQAREPAAADLRAYFEACFVPDRNPLIESLRQIVTAHVEARDGRRLEDLDLALRELPVITIRKYAYEHGFAFFWRALKLPAAEFDVWCDEIEALVNELKTLQYACMKLSQTGDRIHVAPVLAHLNEADRLESRIKGKLAEIFALWCEQQFPVVLDAPHADEGDAMKVSLCTITFRHHLISLSEIATFARANDFQGIELWAAHGRNMAQQPDRNADWLASLGLCVPMVSDYLPVDADRLTLERQATDVCRMARRWRAGKIRTFAGNRASASVSAEDRRSIARRLRDICAITADFGIHLLAEIHPNTLADTAASTLDLIDAVDHPSFAINFDTLHVWEGGDDPVSAHRTMKPFIRHYHLKNIRSRADLAVFEPANVYAAAGSREGMTPLFEGAVDYMRFLGEISDDPQTEVSLEWFGPNGMDVLRNDRREIGHFVERRELPRLSVNF